MTIGVLQLELFIGDAMSLKDKRRVVKSLKDRIAHGHNVSIAEVGALDAHRRSMLAVAMVSNDSRYVEGALSKLVDFVKTVPQVELVDYQIDEKRKREVPVLQLLDKVGEETEQADRRRAEAEGTAPPAEGDAPLVEGDAPVTENQPPTTDDQE